MASMPENQRIEIANCFLELYSSPLDILEIPILPGDIRYDTFFSDYLLRNRPCVLQNISLPWSCSENWVNSDNTINYDYFMEEYGNLDVPVADCDTLSYNAHRKQDMKVKEYIEYIRNPEGKVLYLKDWHLKRIRPDNIFYEVPSFFASDWLNEYALDHNEDDFMFVYIGPRKSWTPLHADVYSSYSWSVNIAGLKKWILFPPGEENKLKDTLGNLPLNFDPDKYENIKYFEISQKKGDAIFVPSGWYHQVANLEDTISINHNWINGCNIKFVWKALEDNLKLVENEIKEFSATPEFDSQCQLMLKSLFGMDYNIFFKLVIYISEKRLVELKENSNLYYNKFIFGSNHIKFDLKCILNIYNVIVDQINHYDKYLTPSLKDNILSLHHTISLILK